MIIEDSQSNEFRFKCENCKYYCNEKSKWTKHILSTKHTTGIKKIRSDYTGPYNCNECDYKTKNKTIYKQHVLNYHSTKEKREKEFKYYCILCDYGSFSKDLLDRHNLSLKHKRRENYNK
jgi:hypothetical protein